MPKPLITRPNSAFTSAEGMMSRKQYSSDVTQGQFEPIRVVLAGARKKTCPRKQDLDDIFGAIFYLLKNAATWRARPGAFPSPSTVRYYFDQWSKVSDKTGTSLLEQALKNLVMQERVFSGKKPLTSFCIADAHSVRNTGTAMHQGYDAGKRSAVSSALLQWTRRDCRMPTSLQFFILAFIALLLRRRV